MQRFRQRTEQHTTRRSTYTWPSVGNSLNLLETSRRRIPKVAGRTIGQPCAPEVQMRVYTRHTYAYNKRVDFSHVCTQTMVSPGNFTRNSKTWHIEVTFQSNLLIYMKYLFAYGTVQIGKRIIRLWIHTQNIIEKDSFRSFTNSRLHLLMYFQYVIFMSKKYCVIGKSILLRSMESWSIYFAHIVKNMRASKMRQDIADFFIIPSFNCTFANKRKKKQKETRKENQVFSTS